jgi:hypothetical protein
MEDEAGLYLMAGVLPTEGEGGSECRCSGSHRVRYGAGGGGLTVDSRCLCAVKVASRCKSWLVL